MFVIIINFNFYYNFLILVIPVGVKWYPFVILICVFMMTNDVEHLFMCLLAICTSSLVALVLNYRTNS